MMHLFAPTLSWLLPHFASLSRIGSGALIAAVWQGALLALIAALALRLAPRIPAAARFAIWFAVFTLIAALPFLGFIPRSAAQLSPSTAAHAWLHLDSRWTLAIAVIWAAASLFRAITLIAAALRVRTLSRTAAPLDLSSAPSAANRRAQLCASTDAQLCASSDIDRPTVIGFFSPKILIPSWLLDKLSPADLEHIVLHEAGHLNRADDWLNLLQKLALVLFPLNPALAWVERRLCFERELACDERVLAILAARSRESARAATGYASSLTTLAEYRLQHRSVVSNLALALCALGTSARQSELGRRVAGILQPAARMKPLHVRFATTAAIAALLFATTELEHTPQLIAFTSPAPAEQLATTASAVHPEFLPGIATGPGAPSYAQHRVGPANDAGYRAIPARFTRAVAPQGKVLSDAAPRLATSARARLTKWSAMPRMIAARQTQSQPELVITRWAVFQSPDGYRVVRTSAVFSDAPASPAISQRGGDSPQDSSPPQPSHAHLLHARQISQPIAPYAAVPVPGGWLVFQL